MMPRLGLLPTAPRMLGILLAALLGLLAATPARAHPLPISSLDLTYAPPAIEGRLVIHMRDLAPDLGLPSPGSGAPDPASYLARTTAIEALLGARLRIGGQRPDWHSVAVAAQDGEALQLDFAVPGPPPGALTIAAQVVPSDPDHQTFVNVYEGGELRQQWLLGARDGPVTYFAGSRAGLFAVAGSFLVSGIHHILIGPDHIAFLIGLILLGGSLRRLVTIVTAFTLGHSITLSLSATGLFVLPEALVEPAIALSIVVVGVDNLLRGEGRDIRAWLAGTFGLVHGFGFAWVLRAFGLPAGHQAVALVSFNLGVEVGQIAIVLVAGTIFALVRQRGAAAARALAVGGSLAVAAAGAYWFIDRVF